MITLIATLAIAAGVVVAAIIWIALRLLEAAEHIGAL